MINTDTEALIVKAAATAILLACLLLIPVAGAQNISLDHPQKCGRLQCFPAVNEENAFYYLPSNPHLALNEDGDPEFSFTRYVDPKDLTGSEDSGIKEAGGGGIVHFLVDYTVPKKMLRNAEAALREDNKDAEIRGPIVFEDGSFALVSSFAEEEDSELTKHLIGFGRAPLVEGLKAGVSIHLTKRGSQILWESFAMNTPDVSLVFEMSFSGLNDPANATITADFTKLQKQADITIDTEVSYLGIGGGFDYQDFWEKAKQEGAITIDYQGDPERLQSIIDRTYTRLHELMFEPLPAESTGEEQTEDILEAINAAAAAAAAGGPSASYSAPWKVNLQGGYKRRNISREGNYVFNFRERSKSTLTTAMAGNIGSLYKKYGDDPRFFQIINIGGDNYRVRDVSVGLDAYEESEFRNYINHVTFTLNKKHRSGEISNEEATFNRSNFASGKRRNLSYGWHTDDELEDWLQYDYRIDWSFVGGAEHNSGWQQSDLPAITLTPPYQYREVEFISSQDILEKENVRKVSIRVEHEFFGRPIKETITLLPEREQYSAKKIFAVPPGNDSIKYTITWTLNDRSKVSSGPLSTTEAVIFCDELPPI